MLGRPAAAELLPTVVSANPLDLKLAQLRMGAVRQLNIAKDVFLNDVLEQVTVQGSDASHGLVIVCGALISFYDKQGRKLESSPQASRNTLNALFLFFFNVGDVNFR